MWKCPACETLNNEDVCVICGEVKPTAAEIAQMEREERERAYSPSFVEKKSVHGTPEPAPYKEIVTGESLKKWTKYIVIAVVIALGIWGIVAMYNSSLPKPEDVVERFEMYSDTHSGSMVDVFPGPIQNLNDNYSSALYEMNDFCNVLENGYSYDSDYRRLTQYDLEIVSKTKLKGPDVYQAESELNDNVRMLYERYSSSWNEYINIDGACKLYIKKDVTTEESYNTTSTDTEYFEIYAYKIGGEWYLDYSPELFSY